MNKFVKYIKECALEMKKVSWPSRQMVLSSTKVVIITTIVFAIVLGLVDFLLLKGIFLMF
ncbi:MAG: preprotein translocase subunit SecE [Sphaerochaetaceae bacterium]|nr:preprotein translocase subunit SecE [Sphaerochaetaceae bacterium]